MSADILKNAIGKIVRPKSGILFCATTFRIVSASGLELELILSSNMTRSCSFYGLSITGNLREIFTFCTPYHVLILTFFSRFPIETDARLIRPIEADELRVVYEGLIFKGGLFEIVPSTMVRLKTDKNCPHQTKLMRPFILLGV